MGRSLRTGIDVGSTTVKISMIDSDSRIVFSDYRRHNADIITTMNCVLGELKDKMGDPALKITITGSAGLGLSERFDLPFQQEVVSSAEFVKSYHPEVRTLVDVGGEDSKMIFFDRRMRPDIRMNGNCAGGTGAFIDQMATLLDTPVEGMNELASRSKERYTIASRCGVFAKTDVQNLLSRDVPPEDIAASVFRAVSVQTISTLSRGFDPQPKVMFCGGPLTFIPELRKVFMENMDLKEEDVVIPERPELVPSIGAALLSKEFDMEITTSALIDRLNEHRGEDLIENRLEPLFSSKEELSSWSSKRMIPTGKLSSLKEAGQKELFLGVDSGSTTTKIALIDRDMNILYSYYSLNRGNSVRAAVKGLKKMVEEADGELNIRRSAVTGYGEDLIRAALGIDDGLVETMAHFRAARVFRDDVSFILDIGGQDMKAIYITDGVIDNIEINEACSSGCGSFIETFANSLGMEVSEFARKACNSKGPTDLGTRCTVFMNSKVKQSLREGASVEDISAGLAYSVVKNCLYKVLKINDRSVLGDNIVVQGGTFRNPAVHRALEKVLGKEVICSDAPELMGAYGAALFSMDSHENDPDGESSLVSLSELDLLDHIKRQQIRCGGCENRCRVTRLTFPNGEIFHTGNRCERIFSNRGDDKESGYNGMARKREMLFKRSMEPVGKSSLTIGIPRVLNVFENFPFWCTLLVKSGIKVVLSDPSTEKIHEMGSRTIMSENICFPAKLTNGHIISLKDKGVDRILYPMVVYERKEFPGALNSFNCPIVTGYPDVIKSAISPEKKFKIPFDTPSVNLDDISLLKKACWRYLSGLGVVDRSVFERAFMDALSEQERYSRTIVDETQKVVERAKKEKRLVVLLLSRPYHVDPLINHNVPEIISSYGVDVITEDSLPLNGSHDLKDIQVLTQWEYPNRIFKAAKWARDKDNLEVVQLNSFGCGPDAIICDEARSVLAEKGKRYTLIRIDEVASPGSVKLRLRSMLESIEQREGDGRIKSIQRKTTPPFTSEHRSRRILVPFFSEFYSPLIERTFAGEGYIVETLPPADRESVETGLKYVNNEICYPAMIVIGDIIKALKTGKYDTDDLTVGITQTGGQCRASSYMSLLKKALVSSGFEDIPVITVSLSNQDLNYQPGLKFRKRRVLKRGIHGLLVADSLMQMYNSTAFKEINKGTTRDLMEHYMGRLGDMIEEGRTGDLPGLLSEAVDEFNRIEVEDGPHPVIGFVGEIYAKYNPYGNLHLVEWMMDQKVEVVVPPLWDFFAQAYLNHRFKAEGDVFRKGLYWYITYPVEWFVKSIHDRYEKIRRRFRFYRPYHDPAIMSGRAEEIIRLTDQFGEGWLISAEISTFAREGISNVLCVQPFGCIANHVIGKGVEKGIKDRFPQMNILYLDMDAGSSEVNLLNRLSFLVRSAREDVQSKTMK